MRILISAKTSDFLKIEADYLAARGLADIPRNYFPLIVRKQNDLSIDVRSLLFFDTVCLSAAALAEFLNDAAYPYAHKELIKELCRQGRIAPVDTDSALEQNGEALKELVDCDDADLVKWMFLYRRLLAESLGMPIGKRRLEVRMPFIEFNGMFMYRTNQLKSKGLMPDDLGNFFYNWNLFRAHISPKNVEFSDRSLQIARYLQIHF